MRGNMLRSESGFSLAEVVWAAMILFIVAMGVLGAITFAATSTTDSGMKVSALNLANQRLEQARNLPYDSVGTKFVGGELGDPPGSILTPEVVAADDGREYTVETDVAWARDPDTGLSLYKEITVRVAWGDGDRRAVSVSTNVFGKSDLVNTGDLSLEVHDLATDELLPGSKVTITPTSGAARVVTTDENGEAFFGHLPTGEYTVAIVKTGYVFDTSSPAGKVTVTADLLTSVVAYLQEPSVIRVKTTSDGTSPLAGATLSLVLPGQPTRYAATDGSGMAQFGSLPTGTYQLRADYAGRSPVQQAVIVSTPGETVDVTLTMPSRAGFVVRVVDSSSNTLPGAAVSVRGPSPGTTHVPGSPGVTASNGEISFGTPADGTYTIAVSLAGYTTVTQSVTYDGSVGLWQIMLSQNTPGSMQIHTVDRRGRSTANQTVYVDGPNYSRWRQTDANGYLTITGLTPGTYAVTDRDTGRSYTVQVLPGEESYVEVRTD